MSSGISFVARSLLAATLVIAVAACGDKYNPDAVIRKDSSGIDVISNSGNYHPIAWRFDTVSVIGVAGDSAFQRIREHTVQVGRDGHIYILDTGTRRIDIYDADGKRTATIPPGANGKLVIPSAIVLRPGGFAVYDADKPALVSFSTDGKYIGTMRAPRQYLEGVMRTDSDAIIIAEKVHDAKSGKAAMSIERISATDTTSIIAAQIDDEMSVQFPGCGINMALAPIFGDPPAWDARNGITAVAEAPLYGVRMYRGLKEFRRVRRRLQPESASGQYALLAAGDDRKIVMPDGKTCTITPVEVARGSGWKDVIPAIGAIAITNDDGLWLRRVDPGRAEPAVDVINAKGEYVGTLPMHTPWPLGFLPNGNPVVLSEDTAGVSRVIVYHIDRNPKPAPVKK